MVDQSPTKIQDVSWDEWLPFLHHADANHPQIVLRFPNNWGASIIPDTWNRSLIELAVVHFDETGFYPDYSTPITSDVLRLEGIEVADILRDIKGLPAFGAPVIDVTDSSNPVILPLSTEEP